MWMWMRQKKKNLFWEIALELGKGGGEKKKEMKNIKFCICNDHKDLITFMESTICSITILQVRVGICGYLKVLASCLFNVFAWVH